MYQSPKIQQELILKYNKNFENLILRLNKIRAIRYLQVQDINVKHATTMYLQMNNENFMNIYKKAEKENNNNNSNIIFSYFENKNELKDLNLRERIEEPLN